MQIRENISLRQYNTFGIEATARYFATFKNLVELDELLHYQPPTANCHLILGGGSNILLTKNVDGFVMKNEIGEISTVREDADHFYVKAGGGVNWHSLVMHCVDNNMAGMENLSLIPGSVGASPIQNIGAYGVELKDVFHELEAFHIDSKSLKTFSTEDCAFGYRESVFKHKYKGQFIITSVTFRLLKKPVFTTSYGAIQQELDRMGLHEPTIKAISQAVINIRTSKLPDPKEVGNAGSFFKNPQVAKHSFEQLQRDNPSIPFFPFDEAHVKVPAGWLIEQCGWKGYRRGDAGCYEKQALVLVNYGKATGNELFNLSDEIVQSVKKRFTIKLEREVNVV